MLLPKDFTEYTEQLFGADRWQLFEKAIETAPPTSIRLNPWKSHGGLKLPCVCDAVPWCKDAYYLKERPLFTFDPLFHAGAYYVQEASSMFLDQVLRSCLGGLGDISQVLDLSAAPGGKSTLMRAALPDSVLLFSNEPDRKRANVLMENMQKQGHPNVVVTNNYAIDYQRAGMTFDIILADMPCSGEGMFRKDEVAIREWSIQKVLQCQELQRSIAADIWPCLKCGGMFVYSTCTFNTRENEENVCWIVEELGAELLTVETKVEWGIAGSLLSGWSEPVYRFIPGLTNGEGLFMAVLRKTSSSVAKAKHGMKLRVMSDGRHHEGTQKGRNIIPAHAEALLINLQKGKYPMVELSEEDAMRYLRREAISLPEGAARGFAIVTCQGLPLGFVKNIGNRANNLYPMEWRVRGGSSREYTA